MIDIFKLFHVETKEDIYTFCLQSMLENGGDVFRERVGKQFGFNGADYGVLRSAFTIEDASTERTQIIPDLILYNQEHLAIIESKMFSSEGNQQTADYEKSIGKIKTDLHAENAEVSFYYLTLSGISPENSHFKPVKWNEFYGSVLKGIEFEDECLELLRKTILTQVNQYNRFQIALKSKPYSELFNSENYWITPLSLFASGAYDKVWQASSSEEQFIVWNGLIGGRGHSEFTTNLEKTSWKQMGMGKHDNLHLFIRIAWKEDGPDVMLCWEYIDRDSGDYIATNKIEPPEFQKKAISYLANYKDIWRKQATPQNSEIQITRRTTSSIKALKCRVSGKKRIDETVQEVNAVISYFSEEIEKIIRSLTIENGFLSFSEDRYQKQYEVVGLSSKSAAPSVESRYSNVELT